VRYTCTASKHGPPFAWTGTATSSLEEPGAENKTEELGLYIDLPHCLVVGEPFVEYGIVEDRYSRMRPEVYATLIADYGHTRQGPKRYTASAFIAKALGTLFDRGDILWRSGPATGYWAYNGAISYWALPPRLKNEDRLTYRDWAIKAGLDPDA